MLLKAPVFIGETVRLGNKIIIFRKISLILFKQNMKLPLSSNNTCSWIPIEHAITVIKNFRIDFPQCTVVPLQISFPSWFCFLPPTKLNDLLQGISLSFRMASVNRKYIFLFWIFLLLLIIFVNSAANYYFSFDFYGWKALKFLECMLQVRSI